MSTNLYNVQLEDIFVHRVGNRNKGEDIFISELPVPLNDERHSLLKEYYLKPFRDKEADFYCFSDDEDLDYNVVYGACAEVFADPDTLMENSQTIARHLYQQSDHPHIRSGEVQVVFMKDAIVGNEKCNAIGIFKSEIKKEFVNFKEDNHNRLEMELQQGIDLSKLDKGCIVFDLESDKGYKVLSVDSNKYDAKYWVENFLDLDVFEDENFLTKKYLKFTQDFAKDVVGPAAGKLDEIKFAKDAAKHFASNEDFNESVFLNEVLIDPTMIAEYKNYKVDQGAKHSIEDTQMFNIANPAVQVASKKLKTKIVVDTGAVIDLKKMQNVNEYVERGFDEERGMYYYLIYHNTEEK